MDISVKNKITVMLPRIINVINLLNCVYVTAQCCCLFQFKQKVAVKAY